MHTPHTHHTHTPHTHTHTSHHTHTCTHTHKQRYDPAVNYDSGSDDEDFEPNNVSVTHTHDNNYFKGLYYNQTGIVHIIPPQQLCSAYLLRARQ